MGWLPPRPPTRFQATWVWHAAQPVGKLLATWFGAVLKSDLWQKTHSLCVPTNWSEPCAPDLWQLEQSTPRCPPCSGNRLS